MPRPHISVFIAQSVDGYIATDDDSLDWLMAAGAEGEDYGFDEFLAEIEQAGNVALGKPFDSQQVPVRENEGGFGFQGH